MSSDKPTIKITPRWEQMDIVVALKFNEIISYIGSTGTLICKRRLVKLLKALEEHLHEIARLQMFVDKAEMGDSDDEQN